MHCAEETMLFVRTLIIAVSTTLAVPAGAGIIDLSKPETGKSRFVFNLDGTPVDIGPSKIGTPAAAAAPQGDREPAQRMRSTKAIEQESTIKSRKGAAVVIVNREGRTNGADRAEPRTSPRIRFGRRR
jgi:hypothetical protein